MKNNNNNGTKTNRTLFTHSNFECGFTTVFRHAVIFKTTISNDYTIQLNGRRGGFWNDSSIPFIPNAVLGVQRAHQHKTASEMWLNFLWAIMKTNRKFVRCCRHRSRCCEERVLQMMGSMWFGMCGIESDCHELASRKSVQQRMRGQLSIRR